MRYARSNDRSFLFAIAAITLCCLTACDDENLQFPPGPASPTPTGAACTGSSDTSGTGFCTDEPSENTQRPTQRTAVPTPTPTAGFTLPAPTTTATATPDASPTAQTPGQETIIHVESITYSADAEIAVPVRLVNSSVAAGGVQNDILFDNTILNLAGASACVINRDIGDRLPACEEDPPGPPCKTLSRQLSVCGTDPQPPGCPADSGPHISRFRAIIAATAVPNSSPIPDDTLYTCTFAVVGNVDSGGGRLTVTNVVASDPNGERIPARGIDGGIVAIETEPCAASPLFDQCIAAETSEDCLAAGGRWERGGLDPAPQCLCPTGQEGCRCTDSSQCLGGCVAPGRFGSACLQTIAGRCVGEVPSFGCLCMIKRGGGEGILCRD